MELNWCPQFADGSPFLILRCILYWKSNAVFLWKSLSSSRLFCCCWQRHQSLLHTWNQPKVTLSAERFGIEVQNSEDHQVKIKWLFLAFLLKLKKKKKKKDFRWMCVDYEELMIKKEVKMSERVHSFLPIPCVHDIIACLVKWFCENSVTTVCHLKPQTHPKHWKILHRLWSCWCVMSTLPNNTQCLFTV